MFLLDTNVVSESRKYALGRCDERFSRWAERTVVRDQFLSVVAIEEIEMGILLIERRNREQGERLREWLERRVMPRFSGRILPVDTMVALRSARLHVPDPKPIRDAFIAGTALVHGLTVVTRNVADFLPMGVTVFNPWQD